VKKVRHFPDKMQVNSACEFRNRSTEMEIDEEKKEKLENVPEERSADDSILTMPLAQQKTEIYGGAENSIPRTSSSALKKCTTQSHTSLTRDISSRMLSRLDEMYHDHIWSEYVFYQYLKRMILSDIFQTVVVILILFSSYADTTFVVLFTIEMILKIIVMGLIGFPDAYLNDPWNQMDAGIVATSLINRIVCMKREKWGGRGGQKEGAGKGGKCFIRTH
ncbi:hypothetical protein RFI_05729, partial [Reticulomyxa filosa]